MASSEWRSWRQVAETFAAERPSRGAELNTAVLALVLGGLDWGSFLAGRWIGTAAMTVYCAYVPGFAHARTHQLLDRFVTWLHARGEIDEWQRRVLGSRIDDAREARGVPRRHADRVLEHDLLAFGADVTLREFTATLDDPMHRDLTPQMTRVLAAYLEARLGQGSRAHPAGSFDPALLIDDALRELDGTEDALFANRSLLLLVGRFYQWLGATGRLDPDRARSIAAPLAAACLGLAAA